MKKFAVVIVSFMVYAGYCLGAVYKFDFDDTRDIRTESDYLSVTKNSSYSPTIGYGFVDGNGVPTIGTGEGKDFGAVQSPYTNLYGDVVYTKSWDIWFRVDVEPANYILNAAFGIPGWYSWCKAEIKTASGNMTFGWASDYAGPDTDPDPNDGTMKIIDVWNVTNGQARIRKVVKKNSTEDPSTTTAGETRYGSYAYIKAYGWNNTGDYVGQGYYYEDSHRSEFLLLDGVQIAQDDLLYDSANDKYYILIRPWKPGSQAPGYAMLELVPEPTTIGLLSLGLLGFIRKR